MSKFLNNRDLFKLGPWVQSGVSTMGQLRTLIYILLGAAVVSCSPPAERRFKWNLRTTVGQYEKTGRHDPKWDAPAKQALTLYSRWRASPVGQTDDLARQIGRRCQEALAAGCPDPLVLYVNARFVMNQPSHTAAEIAATHWKIAAELKASRYSSLRKFYGFLRAGEHLYQLKPVPKLDVTELMNDAAAQLAIAFNEKGAPYAELDQAAHAFMQSFHRMDINRNWGWGRLQPVLRKQWGANYAAELSRGEAKVD
jgi:hypothetical protein